MTAKLGFLPIIMLLGASAPANAYCSSPSAPYCAARYGAFDSQDDFDRCKLQMSSYQSEAEDYLLCLRSEADDLKRKSDSTIEEYNSTIESFNRRARG